MQFGPPSSSITCGPSSAGRTLTEACAFPDSAGRSQSPSGWSPNVSKMEFGAFEMGLFPLVMVPLAKRGGGLWTSRGLAETWARGRGPKRLLTCRFQALGTRELRH